MPNIPDGAKKPADRLRAEASKATEEFTAELNGVTLRVLPFLDWDSRAVHQINFMNWDGWAAGALHPDDIAEFGKIKATNRQMIDFVKTVSTAAGADVGELFAS
jgi:hypothetical protein